MQTKLASCLIYGVTAFPAHLLAATNTDFVGSLQPFRCSFGCVLLLNQMFWKQCTIRQYRSDLS